MPPQTPSPHHQPQSEYQAGSVRLLMSINEELIKADLFDFIKAASRVRKLQKQYYREKEPHKRKELLIHCKQSEARLDALGNKLWNKHKLWQWEEGFSAHRL